MALQIRRGASADRVGIVPAIGELIYTIDTKEVFIGDGVTAGGNAVGKTIVAGTGINYNSGTGVISTTITQYTDALARAAHSAGTGITYNNTTGVISSSITQYTDALARAAVSFTAGSGGYNSSTGIITIPTNTSHLTNDAGYATETFVNTAVSNLVASAPATLDTLNELAAALGNDASYSTTISTALGNRLRVDVNTQALTTQQKTNAATNLGLATVATSGSYTDLTNKPTIPTNTNQLTNGNNFITLTSLSAGTGITYNNTTGVISSSITQYTDALARAAVSFTAGSGGYNSSTGVITIPTNTNHLTNGAGFLTASDITGKQNTLVSGTNIKTINGTTLLGSGDITISGGGGGGGTTTNKLGVGVGLKTASDIVRTIPNNISPVNSLEYFGNATAVNDTYTVIAAYQKSVASNSAGEVYIYSNATGALLYKIKNPTPYGNAADRFGHSISLNGSYLIIGAPYEGNSSAGIMEYGAVHVYDITTFTAYSGTTITVTSATRTILNPEPVVSDRFGMSVALSGTNLVIGTPLKEAGDQGRAYVYDVTTGTLLYTINDPTSGNATLDADRFGWSVAIKDNIVVIGAPGESDGTGQYAGKAYVFNLNMFPASPATITSSTFSDYGYTINNPNTGPNSFTGTWSNDDFGTSVAVNGTYVAVGSPGDKSNLRDAAYSAGKVYVFNKTSGVLVYTLAAPTNFNSTQDVFSFYGDLTLGGGNRFGHCVAMSDTHLLTGSKNAGLNTIGMGYLFDLSSGVLVKDFINPNYNSTSANPDQDGFGSAVSIYNNTYMVIGAPLENYGVGAAYFFQPKLEFDGSTGLVVNLNTTGVIGGSYGSGNWGDTTAYIPTITVDGFGRVVSAKQTQVMLGQTPPNSFTTWQVNSTPAFTASSTSDTVNFVGTGGTTVTSGVDNNGVKTITINSTVSSGGGSSGPTEVSLGLQQVFYYTAGPVYIDLTFSSPSSVTTFLNNVGTNVVTVTGLSGPSSGSGTLTITPAEGSWQQSGSAKVRLMYPLLSIPIMSDYFYPATAATYSYTASAGGNPQDYFVISSASINGTNGIVSGPTIAGRLLIADPYVPGGGSLMNINTMSSPFEHITWMSTAGSPGPNGTSYPWLSMQSVSANSTLDVGFNNPVYGTIGFFMYVLDASSNYNTQEIRVDNGQGSVNNGVLTLTNLIMSNGVMWNQPGWLYGAIFSQGQSFDTLSPSPNITTYWDAGTGILWFRCPAAAWAVGPNITIGSNAPSGNFGYQAIYFGSP